MKWKTLAIILMVVLVVENLLFLWGYSVAAKEERQILECYYEVCAEYPDAELTPEGVCHCYSYDVLGNSVLSKSELMD